MPRLTRRLTAALLAAAALWLGLRYREAPPLSSHPGVCEEWQGAETATQELGWDLTYQPLLARSGLCPGDPFCRLLTVKPPPPVGEHLAEWRDGPIVSSILVELPDGHADMAATWLVRTEDGAFWWGFHPQRVSRRRKQPVPAAAYDSLFETMACWRQGEPPKRTFGAEGYIGFLSLYKEGRSRQMLLTYGDLFEGSRDPDEARPGRYWRAVLPLMSSAAELEKESAPDHK